MQCNNIPPIYKEYVCKLNLPQGVEFDPIENCYIYDDGRCYESLEDIEPERFNAVHEITDKDSVTWKYKRHVFCIEGEGDDKSVHAYREFSDQNGRLVYYKTA